MKCCVNFKKAGDNIMPRTSRPRKLYSSKWSDFSDKLVKFYGLPNGSEFRLYRKKIDGRRPKVRSDMMIKRRGIKNLNEASGDEKVIDILADVTSIMSTDIAARGLKIALYNPKGKVVNGKTLISTVRDFDPKPTKQDKADQANIEAEIQQMKDVAASQIYEAASCRDDAAYMVSKAYVGALFDTFGRSAVEEVFEKL